MRHVLLAYADGESSSLWAEVLQDEIETFISAQGWQSSRCRFVQQENLDSVEEGSQPIQEVGLNLAIDLTEEDWHQYVLPTLSLLKALFSATGVEFVIALHDSESNLNEDVAWVGANFSEENLHEFVFGAA